MSQESIKIQLDKINSLFEVFFKDGIDKTSKLERDLLKIQLNGLIKEIDSLDKDNLTTSNTLIQKSVQQIEDVAKAIDESFEEKEVSQVEPVIEEPKIEKEEVIVEEEVVEEEIVEEEPVEEIPEEVLVAPKEEVVTNTKIQFIADEVDEDNPKADLEEKIFTANKPTRSLKEIIDLNKSFIFRAELFANNNQEYQSFIEELNALNNEEASFDFVAKTAALKSWDKEEKVYELLLRAVEKRFLPLI